jgi:hypothetical protein
VKILVAAPGKNVHRSVNRQHRRPALTASVVRASIIGFVVLASEAGGEEKTSAFVSLFDGKSLDQWVVAKGSEKVWRVRDGVIEHAGGQRPDDRAGDHLFTRNWFRDFTLTFEWRFSGPIRKPAAPSEAGVERTNSTGRIPQVAPYPIAGDSGIILRGLPVAEINLWCDPMGSGEIHGFRLDTNSSDKLRQACVPLRNADRPPGMWNSMEITLVADRVTVVHNGVMVIDKVELPGWQSKTAPQLPQGGPIGLAHETFKSADGEHWTPIQFRNLSIREYPPGPM